MKKYSIIIPFRNTTRTLSRLFESIPDREDIEILLIENSDSPLTRSEIGIERDYILLNAPAKRYAGGARNVGVEHSSGEWLIFADSDDFFSEGAFDVFDKYQNSNYDLICFGCDSVYDDTLEPSDRHHMFNNIIKNYKAGNYEEIRARLYMVVPWAKMVRKSLVNEYNIRFDEVIAANDIYFSTLCGYYSKCFAADESQVYVVTTRKGSLANKWNDDILKSRFLVGLRRNKFLKQHGLSSYQVSVMIYLYKALCRSPKMFMSFLFESIKYKQNIFIGLGNWIGTFLRTSVNDRNKKKYIVNEK